MASDRVTPGLLDRASASSELGVEWRRLTRAATAVAIITSPAPFVWFYSGQGWGIWKSLVATFLLVIAFRGLVDLMIRKLLPWPSLYGTDDADLKEEDVVNRRRASFWRYWLRFFLFFAAIFTIVWLIRLAIPGGTTNWIDSTTGIWTGMKTYVGQNVGLLFSLPIFFLFNFLIFLGPMMLIGISQMRGFEPGDADWGVHLDDVRGQDEAKAEVGRVVSLWQSGEAFEAAGGKRERGPAVYLRRGNLKAELSKPLEQTLPRHDVVTTSSLTIAELRTIERLTQNSLFPSSFQQSPNGRTLLLLGTGNQEAPSGG